MPNPVSESGQYTLVTATGSTTVYSGACTLMGMLVSSTSGGTAIIKDGSAGAQVAGTIALTAGQWYPLPATLTTGLYITVAGGPSNVTLFYNPGA